MDFLRHVSLQVTCLSELVKNDHLPYRPRASNIDRLNEDCKFVAEQRTGHWLPKKGWLKPRFPFLKKNKQSLSFSTCISSPPLSRVLRALQWVPQCLVAGVVLLRNSSKNGVDPFSPSLGEILRFISMTCPSLILHFFSTTVNPHLSASCSALTAPSRLLALCFSCSVTSIVLLQLSSAVLHPKNWMRKRSKV